MLAPTGVGSYELLASSLTEVSTNGLLQGLMLTPIEVDTNGLLPALSDRG